MKVAIFAPYDLAAHGGIASHIRAQGRTLRSLGYTVEIFGPASKPLEPGETALSGSTTVRFGGTASGAAFNPVVFPKVAALLHRGAFDIVHVHEPLMPLLPWAAVWSSRSPVVATFHVHREHGHRWYPIARPLLQTIVNRIDARIAVSEAARRTVAASFPGDYEVIPNGIELERFRRDRPRPNALGQSGSIVLCVGRLEPRKGVTTLIDAMRRVQQRAGEATLVLVGDGPDRAALEARARTLNVRLIVVRDVDDETLPAYYQHADVVCAPAVGGESFGIVLIEALAAGTPVVASRLDGYVAAVGDSGCVRWVVPGDAGELAAALMAQLELERQPIRDAAVRVASTYDWRRVGDQLVDVYGRVQRSAAALAAPHTYRR